MLKLTKIAFAACAVAVTAIPAASAADLPYIPEPVPVPLPAVGGWYLRGDIGFSNQQVDSSTTCSTTTSIAVDTELKRLRRAPTFGRRHRLPVQPLVPRRRDG